MRQSAERAKVLVPVPLHEVIIIIIMIINKQQDSKLGRFVCDFHNPW